MAGQKAKHHHKTGSTALPKKKPRVKKSNWHKLNSILELFAQLANAGIVVHAVAQWIAAFAVLAATGFFSYLTLIADPLIYFFRALIRLTRICGRAFFGIEYHEEKYGTHPRQTLGDIISLIFFTLAILTFTGVLTSSPISMAIAWTFAICGLIPVAYFDHIVPLRNAENAMTTLPLLHEREAAKEYYQYFRNETLFYLTLIFGLALLLICGSLVPVVPPLLVPIFATTAKAASILLVAVFFCRAFNFIFFGKRKEPRKNVETNTDSMHPPHSPASDPSPQLSVQPTNVQESKPLEPAPLAAPLENNSSIQLPKPSQHNNARTNNAANHHDLKSPASFSFLTTEPQPAAKPLLELKPSTTTLNTLSTPATLSSI